MRPSLEGEVSLNGEPSGAAQGLAETLRIAILGLGPVGLVRWFTQTPKMMSPDVKNCALVSLLDILASRVIPTPFCIAIHPIRGGARKL